MTDLGKEEQIQNKGEQVVRKTITDYDNEVYIKHNTNTELSEGVQTPVSRGSNRFRNFEDSMYYGDIEDVDKFENHIVSRYGSTPYVNHFSSRNKTPFINNLATDNLPIKAEYKQYPYSDKPRTSFRERRINIKSDIYDNPKQAPATERETTFRKKKNIASFGLDHDPEVTFDPYKRNTQRFSNVSAIPKATEVLNNYKLEEMDNETVSSIRENYRKEQPQRTSMRNYNFASGSNTTPYKAKFGDDLGISRSTANRTTRYSRRNRNTNRHTDLNTEYPLEIIESDSELPY